jgi:predicted nuclease of restriction endonuclease-like RecB superfamily
MLTKDLIRFRRQKDKLKPSFIDTEDWRQLKLAEQLLAVYANGASLTRSEIDEQASMVVNGNRDLKLAKGLNKLCQDRSEFSKPGDFEYHELRRDLFLASAKLLTTETFEDYHDYQMAVYRKTAQMEDFVQGGFYNDLPRNEELSKFKNLSPLELLQRYNCSLVQSLLLHSSKIVIELEDPDAQKLRRLFKYLKFFRLLADIHCIKYSGRGKNKNPLKLRLTVDGPISLFENTSKYGLQLACFFAALPDMDKWKMSSEVKFNNRLCQLDVNQKSGLVSHYRNFTSYVPEEIKIFHNQFKEKQKVWQIKGQTPFIDMGGGEIVFPDLSFQNEEGKTVHLELFHRWHMGQLIKRLEQGAMDKVENLIIGVDRSLITKGGLKETLEANEWFSSRGFLFRDFPGVSTVLKTLKKVSSKAP